MKTQFTIYRFSVLTLICCSLAVMLSFGTSASAAVDVRPSAADLDAIRSDIKYPNYDWMYLDEYVSAEVTPRSVYCFKDPDSDIWRDGNVFIVYGGTEVTILAKSEGYSCVILTGTNYAGWINDSYLSEKYSYTDRTNQIIQVSGTPGPRDLQGCNEQVQYPKPGNWLQNYETKYLKTKYGVCAYLRYKPTADSDYYDYVYEKASVTVLARENGFSLVKSNEGMAGWVTSSLLYDSYPGVSSDGQQITNAFQTQISMQSIDTALKDGDYVGSIDWTLNPRLADYSLSFSTGGRTYVYPMDSRITITVYGMGQDGYHEIEYTCEELDMDRHDGHFDFLPGNVSEATISIKNGTIVSLLIRYAE